MSSYNFITIIREFYGITQAELAAYLSVSRSTLAMEENSSRTTLSADQLWMMNRIQLSIPRLNKAPEIGDPMDDLMLKEMLDTQNQKLKNYASDRLKICNYKALKIKIALDKLKEKQERSLKAIGQLSILKKKMLPGDMPLFSFIELRARDDQKQSAVQVQFKLEY